MQKRNLILVFTFALTIVCWMWTHQKSVVPPLADGKIEDSPVNFNSSVNTTGLTQSLPSRLKLNHLIPTVTTPKKVEILKEILQSKNDNDPRLDHDFNQLSPEDKSELSIHYDKLSLESRNERGTIVYLLGKNLTQSKDFEFFQKVLSEKPCLSLQNCNHALESPSDHEEYATQVTLQYPQIVVLKSIESFLTQNPNSPEALKVLEEATLSKNLTIRQMAISIAQRISK